MHHQIRQIKEWKEQKLRQELEEKELQESRASQALNRGQLVKENIRRNQKNQKDAQQKENEMPLKYMVDIEEANMVLEDNKYNRYEDVIPFENLLDTSQFFWYSPVPDLPEKHEINSYTKL